MRVYAVRAIALSFYSFHTGKPVNIMKLTIILLLATWLTLTSADFQGWLRGGGGRNDAAVRELGGNAGKNRRGNKKTVAKKGNGGSKSNNTGGNKKSNGGFRQWQFRQRQWRLAVKQHGG